MIDKNNISFKSIDSILINLCSYYNIIKKQYELDLTGGKNKDLTGDKNKDSNNQKKYYKKYKKLIKSSAKSINYYKNMIQLQMSKQTKLNNYYGNLIGTLKLQRDNLASGFQILGNDFKNKKEKINMLETMINGLEKYIQSSKTIEVDIGKVYKQTGGMIFDEFQVKVLSDMTGLATHISSINNDKIFLESKIKDLHDRMKNIVVEHDVLFKIKSQVEWMVNQLENNNEGEGEKVLSQDFSELYKNIQDMIVKAKEGNISEKSADYIIHLEKYAHTLETLIKSNNSILNSITTDKKPLKDDSVANKLVTETEINKIINKQNTTQEIVSVSVGGNFKDKYYKKQNTTVKTGGNFKDKYYEKQNIIINKLQNTIKMPFVNIEINSNIIIESLNNDKETSDFPMYFGKIVNMVGLIIKLENILNDLNKVYTYLSYNLNVLKYNEKTNDYISYWKEIFGKKKTDFYDRLLKYNIYYENQEIIFEEALKNLKYTKIIINIYDIKTNIDTVLEKLNNTIICMDHIFFLIINLSLVFLKKENETNNNNDNDNSITSIENLIKEKKDNLTKSALLNSSDVYSNLYIESLPDSVQKGGENNILIIPETPLAEIPENEISLYLHLFVQLTKNNLTQSEKTPLNLTNEIQIDKTIELTKSINSLYEKILTKLGVTDDLSDVTSNEELQINSFEEFEAYLKTSDQSVSIITDNLSGKISKPRLDTYKIKLIECKNKLQPYMKNIIILKKFLNLKKNEGKFTINETLKLLKLYNDVKIQIDEGINSYIKLIPMIFFTIEFPPSIYATDLCRFQLTFNSKEQTVDYKFINGLKKESCNNLGLGSFIEDNFVPKKFNSHAGFFESNKSNGTKRLIDDPVIGLGKLIKIDIDRHKPINCIINIMFTLGPSGVGKTVRLFGKPNGEPDDKEGIVPFIINKSLTDSSSSTKKISIAYFVCYGQKTEINNNTINFNELVIFFNINEIDKKTVNNDLKYIPYYMLPSEDISIEKVKKYTQFYSNVVSKKLRKVKFTNLEGFISKGESFPNSFSSIEQNEDKTFREILDSSSEIWKEIKQEDSDKIGAIFDGLISQQKEINTILATKNNIESSRCPTCVLVKIEDTSATSNNIKYFPLFDMAGTENTEQIHEFLNTGRNIKHMAKLVQKVNKITQEADIIKDDSNKQYPSLKDLLDYDNISKYVNTTGAKGGAKNKMRVSEFTQQLNDDNDDTSQSLGKNFLDKIVKEGYYINHTISTLIFASMCVGYSLRTEKTETEDKFDDFIDSVFTEVNKFTCIPSQNNNNCGTKSMMLLKENNTAAIVNSSCIWLQILFSFLYWNEETPDSIKEKVNTLNKDTTYFDYLYEIANVKDNILVKSSEFIPDLLNVKQLLELGKNNYESEKLLEIWNIMNNVNDNEDYNSDKKLTSHVSIVSVLQEKLYIERTEQESGQQVEINTPIKVTISNYKYDDYVRAKKLRQKMNINPDNAYYFNSTQSRNPGNLTGKAYESSLEKLDATEKDEYKTISTLFNVTRKTTIVIDINRDILKSNPDIITEFIQMNEIIKKCFEKINYKIADFHLLLNDANLGIIFTFLKTYFNNALYVDTGKSKKIEELSRILVTKIMYDATNKLNEYNKIFNKNKFTFDLLKDLQQDIKIIIESISGTTPKVKPKISILPKDIINTLNTLNFNFELPNIVKLLKITDTKLKINSSETGSFYIIKQKESGSNEIETPLNEIIVRLENIPQIPRNTESQFNLITNNQMNRIKDGSCTATKMTLMHVTTGQGLKHNMVNEVIELLKTLYEATNLNLTN